MDFDADNNSIFEDLKNSGMSTPQNVPMPELPQQKSLLGSFVDSIKRKLDESKLNKAGEEINLELNKLVNENTETLLILKSFGCKMKILALNTVEITSDEFNIRGHIFIKDDSVEMDEECKKLFYIISNIISGGYRIEDILNKYEQEEFYPIGEIERIPIMYKGNEITASRGRLANPKGEIRTIIFYRGYEITPDENTEEQN